MTSPSTPGRPAPRCRWTWSAARSSATPRVETLSTPEEVAADVDVQRLGGPRILVESTRLLPFGENKITPFLTNVSFDVVAIC